MVLSFMFSDRDTVHYWEQYIIVIAIMSGDRDIVMQQGDRDPWGIFTMWC